VVVVEEASVCVALAAVANTRFVTLTVVLVGHIVVTYFIDVVMVVGVIFYCSADVEGVVC